MQTFLPFPDDRASATVLDDRRLGKQRVEVLQVLRALTFVDYGWRNHPAVRMWRGFVPALVAYGVAVCDEWTARGRADAVKEGLLAFTGGREPDRARLREGGQLPPWFGCDAVHQSHRSALVRKDPVHYRPFFPDVPDDLPYVWPQAVFPRWPLRRASVAPLTLTAALDLVGRDEVGPGWERVITALREGRSTAAAGPVEEMATLGVLAGLVTSGTTVWVITGDRLPEPSPAPTPRAPATGSSLSPSIARPPAAPDLRRIADEAVAADRPEFRFLRPHQLSPSAWGDAGLVVVDPTYPRDAAVPVPPVLPVLRLALSTSA